MMLDAVKIPPQELAAGLVAVSFTYGGYQQTINFGAEVNQPKKNIPRGIFFGIFIIILPPKRNAASSRQPVPKFS